MLDIIEKFKEFFDNETILVLIQPTTPFISHTDIDNCIKKLIKNPKINCCLSVKKVTEYPEWMITKKEGFEDIGSCNDISGDMSVRQNLGEKWLANGGTYAIRISFLKKTKKLIDEKNILFYEMSKIKSLDIDEEDDFLICESLVNSGIICPE